MYTELEKGKLKEEFEHLSKDRTLSPKNKNFLIDIFNIISSLVINTEPVKKTKRYFFCDFHISIRDSLDICFDREEYYINEYSYFLFDLKKDFTKIMDYDIPLELEEIFKNSLEEGFDELRIYKEQL